MHNGLAHTLQHGCWAAGLRHCRCSVHDAAHGFETKASFEPGVCPTKEVLLARALAVEGPWDALQRANVLVNSPHPHQAVGYYGSAEHGGFLVVLLTRPLPPQEARAELAAAEDERAGEAEVMRVFGRSHERPELGAVWRDGAAAADAPPVVCRAPSSLRTKQHRLRRSKPHVFAHAAGVSCLEHVDVAARPLAAARVKDVLGWVPDDDHGVAVVRAAEELAHDGEQRTERVNVQLVV